MLQAVRQNAFTIVAPLTLSAETIECLERALLDIDPVLTKSPRLQFTDFDELHYCALILVTGPKAPYLVFEGNIDGEVETFLRRIADPKGLWHTQLETIYQCCQGYGGPLAEYLLRHDQGAGTWYVAFRGRSAVEIRKEDELRREIESFLDRNAVVTAGLTPPEVRALIQHAMRQLGHETWARNAPRKPFLVRYGRFVGPALAIFLAVALLPVTLALLVAVGLALLRVRQLERRDSVKEVQWQTEPIKDSEVREDRTFQNHMCSVTEIKSGWLRPLVLRTSLTVVGLAHRFWFNRGDLGGIPTIHFARWIIPAGRRQLVFLSNFDGSWERYLGDFIEQASVGLNSIWANTEGYPRTQYLVNGGADDEERFKAFARNSMRRTRVWYSAYRDLSVGNLADNAKLREGLFEDLSPDEVDHWLRLL